MSDVSDGVDAADGMNLTDVPPDTSPLKSPGSGGGSLGIGGSDDEGAPGMELDLDGEDMDSDEITMMMGGWTCVNCTVANPDHRELCMVRNPTLPHLRKTSAQPPWGWASER